jgi:MFS family permease
MYMTLQQTYNLVLTKIKKSPALRNFLLLLPIILYSLPLIMSGERIIPGDPDYMFQLYEAFRRSVLEYHQLPFWNGWVAGGIPLFANVHFGLISIPSFFVLIFGSVLGVKLAVVALQVIAFFGYKKLFSEYFKTGYLRSICLSYIPIFGSFFVYRSISGHFNFLLIAFVPWLLWYFLNRKKRTYAWVGFAATYSLMIWSSPHNTTIMSVVVVMTLLLYELIYQFAQTTNRHRWKSFVNDIRLESIFLLKSFALILLLTFYRLFFVFEYIKDFPRLKDATEEPFTGIYKGLYAIWGPNQYNNPPSLPTGWGWTEATTYIGIGTLVCLLLILGVALFHLIKRRKSPFNYPILILLVLFLTFFSISMANFGRLSPFVVMNKVPIFDSMRVATRWLVWPSIITLLIIAAYNGKYFKKTINLILALTVIELFVIGSGILGRSFNVYLEQYRKPSDNFNQVHTFHIPRTFYADDPNFSKLYAYDENLLETTRNNFGQVIAGDSLVDTRGINKTVRCGGNQSNCNLISSNAKIVYWSPNKIILERTAPGSINLNINPGKGWRVNGQYIFSGYKITDPMSAFVINDESRNILIEYAPRFSPQWFATKLGL